MKPAAQSFEFTSYNLDLTERKAYFRYTVHISDTEKIEFTETLWFPEPFPDEDAISQELVHACLYNLHLILGISYFKLYCPLVINISSIPLSKSQSTFWNTVYKKGLGEFFYKNKIDFRTLIQFPYKDNAETESYKINLPDKSLVGVGGGKDSIVAIELLKEQKKDSTGFILEGEKESGIIHEVSALAGIVSIKVIRTLDQKMFTVNTSGNVYNGHIPISAIYAFTALLTAALYGYSSIVVANEQSANVGNVTYLHEQINHQWSKSQEFELLFKQYVKEFITPSIHYYSIVRDFSELKIIEKFTHYEKYFPVFSSCNRNFSITKEAEKKWCGECPKCAFVFAGMAAFLPKEKVVGVFNKNLFADTQLIPLYKQLAGLIDIKPFECVGTFDETKLALYLAYEKKEYADDPVIQMFVSDILPTILDIEKLREHILLLSKL